MKAILQKPDKHATGERRYRLTFRPIPSGNLWESIPVAVRLRKLLKLALRAAGFECELVEELEGSE